jgi:hypothetical protein
MTSNLVVAGSSPAGGAGQSVNEDPTVPDASPYRDGWLEGRDNLRKQLTDPLGCWQQAPISRSSMIADLQTPTRTSEIHDR